MTKQYLKKEITKHELQPFELLHKCIAVMEAQVALMAAFRSSTLMSLVSFFFFLTTGLRFSTRFRSDKFNQRPINHSNTMVTELAFGTFGTVVRC